MFMDLFTKRKHKGRGGERKNKNIWNHFHDYQFGGKESGDSKWNRNWAYSLLAGATRIYAKFQNFQNGKYYRCYTFLFQGSEIDLVLAVRSTISQLNATKCHISVFGHDHLGVCRSFQQLRIYFLSTVAVEIGIILLYEQEPNYLS